jgi:hypothetical protein
MKAATRFLVCCAEAPTPPIADSRKAVVDICRAMHLSRLVIFTDIIIKMA